MRSGHGQRDDNDSAGGGAAKFSAGHAAFWGAAAGGLSAFIPGATAIVPPTFAGLASALSSTFPLNVGPPAATLATAMSRLAANIHTATLSTPVAFFGIPSFPIL